ncbi:MAG: nucleotidyltransferase family protein [Chthoniobacterales bacterium]
MHPKIDQVLLHKSDALRSLCGSLDVKQLCVFGSARGESFDPSTSDVDFVVEFERSSESGIADRYMNLADGLEHIFERPVDLLTKGSIRNPIFRQVVEESQIEVYAH